MSLQLPLHKIHETAGAQFSNYKAWELPAHYGNPLGEYQAIRNGLALADLSHQGKWLLKGDEHRKFLKGLISNDLPEAGNHLGTYACFLTAKGKIISDFFLYPLPEGLLMELEYENAIKTKTQFMRFRLRSKVEMTAPNWGRLLISGPKAQNLLEKFFGDPLLTLHEKSFFEKEVHGTRIICIKRSLTGEADFHLYTSLETLEKLWNDLLSKGSDWNILPIGQEALETARIEAGIARYGMEITEDILPNEAGIQDEVISYTKGCFPGQEVIARIKTYGHVNKQLCGVILEGKILPKQGAEVLQNGKSVGWLTSTTQSPFLGKVIAIGYLQRKVLQAGTALTVAMDSGPVSAQTASLPFYSKRPK